MEVPVHFTVNKKNLFGILHKPDGNTPDCVVIMVTGGPQVRYGSHRLYVRLARYLCQRNICVLRFDYEGMGDSEGEFIGCDLAAPSIDSAIRYAKKILGEDQKMIIWTLCDGASAVFRYTYHYDHCLNGMILCNPLLTTEEVYYRRHYYRGRIFSKEFWMRLISLKINFREAFSEFFELLIACMKTFFRKPLNGNDKELPSKTDGYIMNGISNTRFPLRFFLSTDDVVAQEFQSIVFADQKKINNLKSKGVEFTYIPKADHTFTQFEAQEVFFELTYKAVISMCQVLSTKKKIYKS